jgi:hypothetical protein
MIIWLLSGGGVCGTGQPRLPDPSYASPALEVAAEDKSGVHGGRGRWLVNGSPEGLVELAIEPPCYLAPGIDTAFRRQRVNLLTVSLVDPDGLFAALERDGRT